MARAFRLASLLRLRQVQQEQAASDLASANARARESAVRLGRARARLGAVDSEPTDATTLYAISAARASSRGMLAELEAVQQLHCADVDAAGAAYAEARSRSLGLEKLETRHVQTEHSAALAAQQAVVDEIATTTASRPRPEETP